MYPKVNIVPSEGPGWIMGRIIKELSARNGWPVGATDDTADINYFINYYAAKALNSLRPRTITAAWFTHPENSKFFNIARIIDIRVCQATKYARAIGGHVVTPGMDERFVPRLRLGVVGRYGSVRKGAFLVEAVKKLDFVDVVSPPKLDKRHDEQTWMNYLCEFYATLDALLVTSLVEGGPVPAAEAIACGVPVIAPSTVGNLDQFPVVGYSVGNEMDLLLVLREFARPKVERAASVADWTWGRFAEQNRILIADEYARLVPKRNRL